MLVITLLEDRNETSDTTNIDVFLKVYRKCLVVRIKCFKIYWFFLAIGDDDEDEGNFYLQVADQTGNKLNIPRAERKVGENVQAKTQSGTARNLSVGGAAS